MPTTTPNELDIEIVAATPQEAVERLRQLTAQAELAYVDLFARINAPSAVTSGGLQPAPIGVTQDPTADETLASAKRDLESLQKFYKALRKKVEQASTPST